jgi:hypothetical protein
MSDPGRLKTLLVAASAFIAFLLTMNRGLNPFDEGLILTGAMRVMSGDRPHVNFYTLYGPGSLYLLAGLFELFGNHVLLERLYDMVCRAGVVVMVYRLLAPHCRAWITAPAVVSVIFYLGSHPYYGYPIYPALWVVLWSVSARLAAAHDPLRPWPWLKAGLLAGFSVVFRYDIAFFAIAALLISLPVTDLLEGRRSAYRQLFFRAVWMSLGFCIPVLGLLAWYVTAGMLGAWFHDVVQYPAEFYAKTRGLPFPRPRDLLRTTRIPMWSVYLPILSIVAAAAFMLLNRPRRSASAALQPGLSESAALQRNLIAVLMLLVAFFYLKGWVRVSVLHMHLAIVPAIVLSAVVLEAALVRKSRPTLGLAAASAGLFIVCSTYIAFGPLVDGRNLLFRDSANVARIAQSFNPKQRPYTVEESGHAAEQDGLFLVERDRALAWNFLEDNTSPTDTILSALHRHDKIFINDIAIYFMTQRRPATKWHQFDPGVQNTERIQRLMISDLAVSRPKFILRDATWNKMDEPNDSARSTGVVLLDDYIKSNYEVRQRFGLIEIWGQRN